MYQQEDLFDLYKIKFAEKDRSKFDLNIKVLEKHEFLIKSDSSLDYKVWKEITDKGLAYLEYIKKKRGK